MFLDQLVEQFISILRVQEKVTKEAAASKMDFDIATWRNDAMWAKGKGAAVPAKPIAPLVMKFDADKARQYVLQINQGVQPTADYYWYEKAEFPADAFNLDRPAYPEPDSPIGEPDPANPGMHLQSLGDQSKLGMMHTDAKGKRWIKIDVSQGRNPFGPTARWAPLG